MLGAEFKKLMHNITFCVFLCILLLAGILSPVLKGTDENLSAVYQAYQHMSAEEALADIEYQLRLTDIRQTLDIAAQLPADVAQIFLDSLTDEYGMTQEQLAALAESVDGVEFDSTALETVQTHAERVINYPAYLESIQTQEQTIADSILYRDNPYALTLARKTAEEYADLLGTTLPFADPTGVKTALGTWIDDVIGCAIVCLAAMFAFMQERQEGMMPLLFSTKRGRWATYGAKMAVIAILGAVSCILFALFRVIIAGDLGDLSRPAQAIPAFYTSPYPLSVGTLLLLSLVRQIAATVFVGFLMGLLCITLERSIALGAAALIAGTQVLCWQMIDSTSVLQPAKYLSIPALFSSETLLGNAVYVKLLGTPVRFVLTSLALLVLGSAALIWMGSRFYSHSHKALSIPSRSRRTRNKKHLPSLFRMELERLMLHQKAALLLMLVVALQPGFYDSFHSGITTNELRYLSAMKSVEGAYTAEKHQMLLDQQQELNEQLAQTTDPLFSDELSQRLAALDRVLAQADYLSGRAENVSFVYETGYAVLFGSRQIGMRYQPALIALILCLMLPGIFTQEKETGMDRLVQTTPRTLQLKRSRWKIVFLLSALVFAVCWFPALAFVRNYFYLSCWTAPAVSLQMFSEFPGWVPIWCAVAGLWLIRLLMALSYGFLAGIVAAKTGKYIPSVLLSIFIIGITLLAATQAL